MAPKSKSEDLELVRLLPPGVSLRALGGIAARLQKRKADEALPARNNVDRAAKRLYSSCATEVVVEGTDGNEMRVEILDLQRALQLWIDSVWWVRAMFEKALQEHRGPWRLVQYCTKNVSRKIRECIKSKMGVRRTLRARRTPIFLGRTDFKLPAMFFHTIL